MGLLRCLFKSLSGHIPRSSLRSSDLLPFYHQYPAACCGDFLLHPKLRTHSAASASAFRARIGVSAVSTWLLNTNSADRCRASETSGAVGPVARMPPGIGFEGNADLTVHIRELAA